MQEWFQGLSLRSFKWMTCTPAASQGAIVPQPRRPLCCVENAFSLPSASDFPITNFYPNLYTHTASLNFSSVFLWPSSVVDFYYNPLVLCPDAVWWIFLCNCTTSVPNLFFWIFFFFEFFPILHCSLLSLDSAWKFTSCEHSGCLRQYRRI